MIPKANKDIIIIIIMSKALTDIHCRTYTQKSLKCQQKESSKYKG